MEKLSSVEIFASILCGIIYSYYVVSRLPKGMFRLVAVAPVIVLHTALPWQFKSIHMRGFTSFMFTWVSSFKLLMLCYEVGPLATPWAKSKALNFMALAAIPIQVSQPKPKNPNFNNNRRTPLTRIKMALEVCALIVVLYCYSFRDRIPHKLILFLYGLHIYLCLDIFLESLAFIVDSFFGAKLEPQFNKPYLASSLEDFWGKRWNLVVTNILRPSVYNPILHFCWKIHHSRKSNIHNEKSQENQKTDRPPYWARAVAMLSTFIVSGLIHEVMLYYITQEKASWEMMGFFILQGLCTVIEVGLRRRKRFPYMALPKFIAIPTTVIFIYLTGFWLFFPPFMRYGTDIKAIAEYEVLIELLFPTSG